jgi:mono/diheme cytochrome c family protein
MKKQIAPALMVAAGLAWLVAGCASTNTLAVQQADLPKDKVDAPALFAENCATCHGKNGRAHNVHGLLLGAQNLTDSNWHATDEEIIHAIKTGPWAMPAFEKKLSSAEIEALAVYVRTFKAVK